jgi:hypothetical protein
MSSWPSGQPPFRPLGWQGPALVGWSSALVSELTKGSTADGEFVTAGVGDGVITDLSAVERIIASGEQPAAWPILDVVEMRLS